MSAFVSQRLSLEHPHQVSAATDSVAWIVSRIASHAATTPAQLAVIDGSVRLTYALLEERADQLASLLREACPELAERALSTSSGQAGEEVCVGLFFERSADFVVAALAVLKAGAAYLPLDPSTPATRAAFILSDAGAPLLLTHRNKTRELPPGAWHVLELDAPARLAALAHDRPEVAQAESLDAAGCTSDVTSDRLAYVVYTSGSTGEPKGVEITHANLQTLIEWHQAAFKVTAADRASHVAGLGFDAAGWEIWPHLTAGASLHIADEMTRRSPQALRNWLVAEGITISFVPTVMAEQLLHLNWPEGTALRTLLTGADTLHRRPPAGLPFAFVNNYGPTECTVVATSGIVAHDDASAGTPSIGKPIGNTRALILDDSLRPVPAGEPGELCLAGAHVGRGYRNRPEMTAARFVTFAPESGDPVRIYRTGDRARLLENGEIAFLGRLDDQVKIRGYRIELGEIVACLDRFPGVDASAVIVPSGASANGQAHANGNSHNGDAAGNVAGPALIAYIVAAPQARLNAAGLRDFLAVRLPDYMIPVQYVAIAMLPVTANGKLDKSALPAPAADNLLPQLAPGAVAVQAAKTVASAMSPDVEQRITALLATLLDRPSVDRGDNFFMLGGHSMLGAQLVARVRESFGVKLTLRQLFNAPTVAALSAEIARMTEANAASGK